MKKIIDDIFKEKKSLSGSYSLLEGNTGYLMLLEAINEYDELYFSTEKTISQISEIQFSNLYSNGIAGLLWALNQINKNKTIEYLHELIFDLKELLINSLNNEIKGDFDFLHGYTGIIHNLIELEINEDSQQLIVDYLSKLKEETQSSEKGLFVDFNQPAQKINITNFSLSHGMSALIQVLSRIYKKGIETKISKELVEGYISFILKNEHQDDSIGSVFPSTLQSYGHKSRLAWCYGDLGIAIAIWQAGDNMDNKEWKQIAEDILLKTTERTSLEDAMVIDPMVCHGTAGIATVYNRMWRNTGNKTFLNARNHWLAETKKFAHFNDGVGGYKYYMPVEKKWVTEHGLLEGAIGLALTFLQAESEEDLKWDRALLISS